MTLNSVIALILRFFTKFDSFAGRLCQWLIIDLYCFPVPFFHFWPKLTHPAAQSLCDSTLLDHMYMTYLCLFICAYMHLSYICCYESFWDSFPLFFLPGMIDSFLIYVFSLHISLVFFDMFIQL